MTFVYRYYDQAELERQLNARGTVAYTRTHTNLAAILAGFM